MLGFILLVYFSVMFITSTTITFVSDSLFRKFLKFLKSENQTVGQMLDSLVSTSCQKCVFNELIISSMLEFNLFFWTGDWIWHSIFKYKLEHFGRKQRIQFQREESTLTSLSLFHRVIQRSFFLSWGMSYRHLFSNLGDGRTQHNRVWN